MARINSNVALYYCPLCDGYYDYVTTIHCEQYHGRTKKDIEAEFGEFALEYPSNRRKRGNKGYVNQQGKAKR